MIAMTSNFPERLDAALVRKGRIDVQVEFKRASADIVKQMFVSFYETKWSASWPDVPDYKWTPAEVSAALFNHFSDPSGALTELLQQEPTRPSQPPASEKKKTSRFNPFAHLVDNVGENYRYTSSGRGFL